MRQLHEHDGPPLDPTGTLSNRSGGFSLAEARSALAWRKSNFALARRLKQEGFLARKVWDEHRAHLMFFPPARAADAIDGVEFVPEWRFTLPEGAAPEITDWSAVVWHRFPTPKEASTGSARAGDDIIRDHPQMVGNRDEISFGPDHADRVSGLRVDELGDDRGHTILGGPSHVDLPQRIDDDGVHALPALPEGPNLARRRIVSIDPNLRTRLRRVTATMVSGPDVLRAPPRWRAFFLREDRRRFGDTGPARRRPRWSHLVAAITIAVLVMLAIAGSR
jgi:hypothetical protein